MRGDADRQNASTSSLSALGDGSFARLQSLAEELHEYITTYIV